MTVANIRLAGNLKLAAGILVALAFGANAAPGAPETLRFAIMRNGDQIGTRKSRSLHCCERSSVEKLLFPQNHGRIQPHRAHSRGGSSETGCAQHQSGRQRENRQIR